MPSVTVQVQNDHIDRLAGAKKPILGVAELIWNSFDADARNVTVTLVRRELNSIDRIEVSDDGTGMSYEDAQSSFGKLGGSWKEHQVLTMGEHRLLHGKLGQGRFRAFAVAENIQWDSVYQHNGDLREYSIKASTADKRTFEFNKPRRSERTGTGTVVTLTNIIPHQATLDEERAVNELNKLFALYLRQYPAVRLSYAGTRVDPVALEDHVAEYELNDFVTEDGRTFKLKLSIVEWVTPMERALYLCDENGFTLRELSSGIKAPSFFFTAYVRSKLLTEMANNGTIDVEFGDLGKLLEVVRDRMRQHFLEREAEKSASVVEEWKQQNIYPYDGDPSSFIERTERQVFDVVAANVDAYLPEFKDAKPKNRKLIFGLLKVAVESNPSLVRKVLQDLIGLPRERQDELAELLERTSLSAMISASRIVADRLEFLAGLDYLLYNKPAKKVFKERTQLHRLIAQNTWIFGEEFFLVNDDENLTNVLRSHLKHVSESSDVTDPVFCGNDSDEDGVVDIVLGKELPRGSGEPRHKLVIELKRPTQKIDSDVLTQVRKYAVAVEKDARFATVPTHWTFWAVSNDMADDAKLEANQDNRPMGLVISRSSQMGTVNIWSKTWAQIIEQSRDRLRFFEKQLAYSATHDSGFRFLQEAHAKFVPNVPPPGGPKTSEPNI